MKAIVIGAGAAGLATAGLLAKRGFDVTVLEKNESSGGRAGEIMADGFRFENGPSWYLMPQAFDHFFELMGTSTEEQLDLVRLDPAYRVFNESGFCLDIPAGKDNVIALAEELEPGAGEAMRSYLASASDIYRLAIDRFLYTTFSTPSPFLSGEMIERIPELLVRLVEPLERFVNKQFSHPVLRQVLSYPAVFLSSRPEKTPSLYHLMSHTDLVDGVRYPRGGFSEIMRVLETLARDHGAEFCFNTPVTRIAVKDGKAVGVHVGEQYFEADIVVSTADVEYINKKLVPAGLGNKRTLNPGVSAVVVMLGIKGELPELVHHNLFFSSNWKPDFDAVFDGTGASRSIYVCKPSATDEVAPVDHENIFILVPAPADVELGTGNAYEQPSEAVERMADDAIIQLAAWAGIDDLQSRIVTRFTIGPKDFAKRYNSVSGGAIGPAHTLFQSAFLRGSNASRKVDSLYFAGATTVPGVGVPLCLISAENVIKRLDKDTTNGPKPAL